MRYLAVVDDGFLSNFRLDDDGLTLVVQDKNGATRGMRLKPIIRPTVTIPSGDSVYITDGHINAMIDYETKENIKAVISQQDETFKNLGIKE